ncbi:Putative cytochrome P450 superfamily protein [Zea mays]|uniref:trans-cinnamate 4-monooxygenase n=1 Tax=Zea mays TaxID=4577 RepID=A0A1D6G961_MAIZE|nr:Putative cytochrome P450 superfamily protein [Zea mays]
MVLLFVEKLLVGLLASVMVAIAVSKIRGRKLRLPPGPVPVPVFGNWLQVGDDLNHRNLAALSRKFGDVFLLRMGQRNLVVVSSPPLAREVLHTQGVEFGSRTRNVVFDIFTDKGQDMVFTVYGDHWRKMRRIMTVPFFTNKVVQQYRHGWEAEAAAVVDDVRLDPKAATDGIVLRRRLQLMMYNNIYRIMFDRRFESMDDPLFLRLRALNGERSRLAQSFEYNYGDFIPILRPFLRGYLRVCKEVKETRLKLFKDFFLEERKKLASTKATDSNGLKCAIDHILEAQQKGEINEDNVLFIVENINKHVEANGNDFRYLPFGVGRRSCPGIILALPILGITIGRLVQNFELLPPPGQDKVDTTEKGGQFSLHILKHSTIVCKPRTL